MNIYTFYLSRDYTPTPIQVFPIWKDDLAIEYEMEQGQRFYRTSLSGSLTFVAADFDWVNGTAFDALFTLEIRISRNNGLTWESYWRGEFTKTDCKFVISDRKVTVKPKTIDRYKKVLGGMEREFNLIELTPEIDQVVMAKRPVIQIYNAGENVVSCFCAGLAWEQDCSVSNGNDARRCHFLPIGDEDISIQFDTTETGLTAPFRGQNFIDYFYARIENGQGVYSLIYSRVQLIDDFTIRLVRISDGETVAVCEDELIEGALPNVLTFVSEEESTLEPMTATEVKDGYAIDTNGNLDPETGFKVYVYDVTAGDNYAFSGTKDSAEGGQFYVNWYDGSDNFLAGIIRMEAGDTTVYDDEIVTAPSGATKCKINVMSDYTSYFSFKHETEPTRTEMEAACSMLGLYQRLIADREQITFSGTLYTLHPIASDDIVGNNRNCSYAIGVEHNTTTLSTRTSATPTKWGRRSATTYFDTPDDLRDYFPVARSKWIDTSKWFYFDSAMYQWEEEGRTEFTLKDAFPLYSVLSVLLGANGIGTSVTFQGTSVYSEFLYGVTRPVTPVDTDNTRLFLAPKSNVIVGEYQKPAMKAMITLKDVLEMLRDVYQCYWFIDDDNRMRIEHISWFKNGGTYSGTPQVSIDATQIKNTRNLKTWGFAQTEYSFDKANMPERYQFGWMDEVTTPFIGLPLITQSPFVEKERVEEVTVTKFTSDIDYLMLAPENCSSEGFALMGANYVSGTWKIPFATKQVEGVQTTMQNYFLSFWHLLPSYWLYDVPTWYMNVNGQVMQSHGIQRMKQQTVTLPSGDTDPDPMRLVRTYVGDGEVRKMSIKLSSRMADFSLNFDTH